MMNPQGMWMETIRTAGQFETNVDARLKPFQTRVTKIAEA